MLYKAYPTRHCFNYFPALFALLTFNDCVPGTVCSKVKRASPIIIAYNFGSYHAKQCKLKKWWFFFFWEIESWTASHYLGVLFFFKSKPFWRNSQKTFVKTMQVQFPYTTSNAKQCKCWPRVIGWPRSGWPVQRYLFLFCSLLIRPFSMQQTAHCSLQKVATLQHCTGERLECAVVCRLWTEQWAR